jgi:DNA polymerase-4
MHARNVGLKLRYPDFTTVTRQATMLQAADGDDVISTMAQQLLTRTLKERTDSVRLLGVSVSGLGEPAAQLSLLDEGTERDSAISGAVDAVRGRFGDDAVKRGG